MAEAGTGGLVEISGRGRLQRLNSLPGTHQGSFTSDDKLFIMHSHAIIPFVAIQKADDYDLARSAAFNLAAARDYIEWYIGQGNLKWVLLALLVLIVLMIARRRR